MELEEMGAEPRRLAALYNMVISRRPGSFPASHAKLQEVLDINEALDTAKDYYRQSTATNNHLDRYKWVSLALDLRQQLEHSVQGLEGVAFEEERRMERLRRIAWEAETKALYDYQSGQPGGEAENQAT